jgi:hypothetical protein
VKRAALANRRLFFTLFLLLRTYAAANNGSGCSSWLVSSGATTLAKFMV